MSHNAPRVGKGRSNNPSFVKGGPSPNPKGRPRKSLAFSELIQATISRQELLDFAATVLRNPQAPLRERVLIWQQLTARTEGPIPNKIEMNVKQSVNLPAGWAHMSADEQDQWFDEQLRLNSKPDDALTEDEPELSDLIEVDE